MRLNMIPTNQRIAPRRSPGWILAALFVLAGSSILSAQIEYAIPPYQTNTAPTAITGPDGGGIELFTESSTNSIGFFAQQGYSGNNVFFAACIGAITPCPNGQVNNQPVGIALGPPIQLPQAGQLYTAWFTEYATNQIGQMVYTPNTGTAGSPYQVSSVTFNQFATPTPNSAPYGITPGPDGAFWFTEYSGNNIGRITTAGAITEYAIPTAGSGPTGITAGPDGALWFTEQVSGKIGRITTSGVITEFAVPTPNSSPFSITNGGDGVTLWFTEFAANQIGSITTSGTFTEYPVPTSNSQPAGITLGADNALWFTEENGNQIGRITSGLPQPGWISEYAVPSAGSQPLGISALPATEGVPAGSILFTEYNLPPNGYDNFISLLTPFQDPLDPGPCTLYPGELGVAYTAACSTALTTGGSPPPTGGPPTFTWTATGLPPGLAISPTGAITGTPTTTGSYTVTITEISSGGGQCLLSVRARPELEGGCSTVQDASQVFVVNIYNPPTLTCVAPGPGEVGALYSSTPCTAGSGDPPLSYTATGLPPGLTMNIATGAITGTPTTAGVYNTVVVTVTDSLTPTAQTAPQTISITIYPKVLLTCVAGTSGIVGTPYSSTPCLAGSGDPPLYYTATGLPPGLTMNIATGAITGTPTTAGVYNTVVVTVTDSLTPTPQTAPVTISITIYGKLILTCTAGVEGIAGVAYASSPCAASAGDTPYTYTATGLPPGLSMNAATGAITGTPTTPALYQVTVTVTDSFTPTHQIASQPISIRIVPKLTLSCVGATVYVGLGYPAACVAGGGVLPYLWTASGLPPGLSINASTGQIMGAPTAAGSYPVTVTVVDSTVPASQTASQQFTITSISRLTLTCGAAAPGMVGTAYSAAPCSTSGGTLPYYWTASGLPAGLSINLSSGAITGTPTVAGSFAVNVSVTDSSPSPQGGFQGITIVINPTMLNLTCAGAPPGTVGTSYSATPCSASGGTLPYAYSGSGLPPGLSVNTTTGAITGTPTTANSYTGSVTVTDSSPTRQSASQPITIVVSPAKLSLTCGSAPPGNVAASYSATPCSASGGTPPYTYGGSGLPPGLSVNTSTGAITGTPTTANSYTGSVTVTDSSPTQQSASQPVTIVINPAKLSLTCASAPQGTVGTSYSATPCSASGGTPPYTYGGSGLPPGLSVNTSTGAITGTPTTANSYSGSVTVTDSSTTKQSASQPITIVINPTPLMVPTCASAPQGVVGTTYSATPCSASGGTPPYTYGGSGLPPGLSVNTSTGAINGTPTTPGPYPVTLTVSDSSPTKQTQTESFTISILPGVTINSLSLVPSSTTPVPQSSVTITLANPSADPVTGILCMTVQPNSAVLQPPSGINPYDASFANANASLLKQCPQGAISAISFSLQPSDPVTKTVATVMQGTVAGEINLEVVSLVDGSTSVLPGLNTSVSLTIPPAPPQVTSGPVISSIVNGSFTVSLMGYTNTRQFTEADFTFTPGTTGGTTLNNSSSPVTIAVLTNGADQTQWFQTAASAGLGGSFSLSVSFPFTGDASALGTVSVTLKNSQSH